jgi:hypothetical protein
MLDVVIPDDLLSYKTPPHDTYGLHPVAGLDIAFSMTGDGTQWSLWHGNKELYRAEIKTDNADKLHNWIIQQITHCKLVYKLEPHHVYADGGGLGAPIISRIREAGYDIITRKNEYQAFERMYYENLGAEMWFRVKRLFQQRILVQPTDKLAIKQLTERKAVLSESKQKYKLEPKQTHKQRLGYSPDRADAIVLALSGYPLDVLLSRAPAAQDALRRTARDDIRNKIASYPFDVPAIENGQDRATIYGLNHEMIKKYAKG